jgi:hypothetical protein
MVVGWWGVIVITVGIGEQGGGCGCGALAVFIRYRQKDPRKLAIFVLLFHYRV